MKKSWGLLPKILSGEKTIESRWYKNRYIPWDRIEKGDIVYFKNSGEPITLKANVVEVKQFSDLTPKKVETILYTFGKWDGISKTEIPKYYKLFKDKRYCLLVFLKDPKPVPPFDINKKGFGTMAAWITVKSIKSIEL